MAQIPKNRKTLGRGKARVLIVDDQPVVRERLMELIISEPDLGVCGDVDDPRGAFQLAAVSQPNLIITGLSLKDSHGLEFIKDVHARDPSVKVLVFSMYEESVYAERAIRAGASGFLTKREPSEEVIAAIRRVLSGEIYLSKRATADTVRRFFERSSIASSSELTQLSDRELEVFELIGRGRSSRQIAATLHLSLKTIETYRSRIKVKLKLSTGPELVRQAEQHCSNIRRTRLVAG
jgi:DNA-binding NarL/FixJ family response regulator